jgi:hypothetical protein
MRRSLNTAIVAFSTVLLAFPAAGWASGSANPDEIVSKHLESIGTPDARAAAKSRAAEGAVKFRILSGGTGFAEGKSVFLSDGRKSVFHFTFAGGDYKGEHVVYDGDKTEVRFSSIRQTRSGLGSFLYTYDTIVKEGLLTGPLGTGWALTDLNSRKAKVTYDGLKNVDGQQVHVLHYKPKKSDVSIALFFDSETYRLVRTEYYYSIRAGLGGGGQGTSTNPAPVLGVPADTPVPAPGGPQSSETTTARQFETRYKLTEKYSDYATADGLTLPSHYVIQFSQEAQNGLTNLSEWDFQMNAIKENVSADPRNFQVK